MFIVGMWLESKFSGTKPKPLQLAAMATIDRHQAFLHGKDIDNKSHSVVLELLNKVNIKCWCLIVIACLVLD